MKSLFTFYVLFIFTVTLFAQSDTVVFNYSDSSNSFIFGKTNSKTPKSPLLREAVNPNYDTIFWKKDSSLYTGYLKMLHIEVHYNDTMHYAFAHFAVKNGITNFINSSTFSYRDEDHNKTSPWKIRHSFITDSSQINKSFHSNGLLKSSHEFIFVDSVSFSYYYDPQGEVEYSVKQKNHQFHGPRYIRLDNCCGLTLIYKTGVICEFQADKLIYFNQHQRIITGNKFIASLTKNTKLNWGYQILDDTISDPSEKTVMLYLTKDETKIHCSVEGRGIQSARKKHILKKGHKKRK